MDEWKEGIRPQLPTVVLTVAMAVLISFLAKGKGYGSGWWVGTRQTINTLEVASNSNCQQLKHQQMLLQNGIQM